MKLEKEQAARELAESVTNAADGEEWIWDKIDTYRDKIE